MNKYIVSFKDHNEVGKGRKKVETVKKLIDTVKTLVHAGYEDINIHKL